MPLLSPMARQPEKNAADERFTIITCISGSGSYEAMVICGRSNRVFVAGESAPSHKEAMLNLLDATSGLMSILFEAGKLKKMIVGACEPCGREASKLTLLS